MRIFDDNNNEIKNPDLNLGYLKDEKIVIAHHEATHESPGRSHLEIANREDGSEYPLRVWDEPPTIEMSAWDETEDIKRYILYTAKELDEKQAEKERQERLVNMPTTEDIAMALAELINYIAKESEGK